MHVMYVCICVSRKVLQVNVMYVVYVCMCATQCYVCVYASNADLHEAYQGLLVELSTA